MDGYLHRYLWMPWKWMGRKFNFLETKPGKLVTIVPVAFVSYAMINDPASLQFMKELLPVISLAIALLLIFYSFASRQSARTAWGYLMTAHFFILAGIAANMEAINHEQIILYAGGVALAGVIGFTCLQKIYNIDKDVSLNRFHGYVYEQKGTALLFLVSAIGLLGFPVTTAFVGIDVFFTHIQSHQVLMITLMALCFLFIELAAIRIYCRIFLGQHKKNYHPVAFRSS
jgi:NADH:ubiquinone oxidoreductase subunit 2 (subunit N)